MVTQKIAVGEQRRQNKANIQTKKVMLGLAQGLLRLIRTKPPGNNSQLHTTRGVVRTF